MERTERNAVSRDNFLLRPVNDFSIFTGFSCGLEDLDEFVQKDAKDHSDQLLAVTYAYHIREDDAISMPLAFVSLMNDSLELNANHRKKMFKRAKHYSSYPAVKIGRLGVCRDYQRKKIGSHLLFVIKHLFMDANRTGCRFITVDAYNSPETIAFYEKNDFQFLASSDEGKPTRHMYFDLIRLLIP